MLGHCTELRKPDMVKSKKSKVAASYGDPRKPKRWPAKRIRQEFTKEIKDADKQMSEASFDNIEDMLAWLNEG